MHLALFGNQWKEGKMSKRHRVESKSEAISIFLQSKIQLCAERQRRACTIVSF